jgi:hypothetical protein
LDDLLRVQPVADAELTRAIHVLTTELHRRLIEEER